MSLSYDYDFPRQDLLQVCLESYFGKSVSGSTIEKTARVFANSCATEKDVRTKLPSEARLSPGTSEMMKALRGCADDLIGDQYKWGWIRRGI